MRRILLPIGVPLLPADPIALANALVLKKPALAAIGREDMPNFIKCLHGELEKLVGNTVQLPNLHQSKTVGIFSDYGGDEPDSAYLTYSFLFISIDLAIALNVLGDIHRIRAQHGLLSPPREMAFKNLGYGPLARALPQWLDAIDGIPGMLFTLVVDKKARSVVTRNSDKDLQTLVDGMKALGVGARFTRGMGERFLRIVHCVAYWCSLLCNGEQRILWITDKDHITATASAVSGLRQVLLGAAAQYRQDLHLKFVFGSDDQLPDDHRNMKEFLSYPDLAAGTIGSAFTSAIKRSSPTKQKSVSILHWLCWQRVGLKKITFLCRPEENGIWGGIGQFTQDEVPDSMNFIPINPDET